MQKILSSKIIVLGIIILFIGSCVVPSTGREVKNSIKSASRDSFSEDRETEYWALIFSVGVYKNNPKENRPSMVISANNLYEVLMDSPNWKKDHIHKVTAEAATGRRLIKELVWLIRSSDKDDLVFVYLATHGTSLKHKGQPFDIPPKDESDGADESLVMYHGFDKWYGFIWDDLLNFYLSRIRAKGVCLVVESCHSGGFNDEPFFYKSTLKNDKTESFVKGLAYELSAKNRVVLMSCEEDETCYGSYFSKFLIDGFWGWADFKGNRDGINSAEEAFYYAKYMVNKNHDFNPTILDLYPGEFPMTPFKN